MIEVNIAFGGLNGEGGVTILVDIEFPNKLETFNTAVYSLAIKAALGKFIEQHPRAAIREIMTRVLPPLADVVVPGVSSPRD